MKRSDTEIEAKDTLSQTPTSSQLSYQTSIITNFPIKIIVKEIFSRLDNESLANYALTHHAALIQALPELKRRLATIKEDILKSMGAAAPHSIIRKVFPAKHRSYILTDSDLYGFGDNTHGALGIGESDDQFGVVALPVEIANTIQQVITEKDATFLLTDSAVYVCGQDYYGELGLPDGGGGMEIRDFTQIPLAGKPLQLAVKGYGEDKDTFILTDAGLYTCGNNGSGLLGLGTYGQGEYWQFKRVSGISGEIKHMSLSHNHSMIATETEVYTCGDNSRGQLGLDNNLTNVIDDEELTASFTKVLDTKVPIRQLLAEDRYSVVLTDCGLYICGGVYDITSPINNHFTYIDTIPGKLNQIIAYDYHGFIVIASSGAYRFNMPYNGVYYQEKDLPKPLHKDIFKLLCLYEQLIEWGDKLKKSFNPSGINSPLQAAESLIASEEVNNSDSASNKRQRIC